MKKSFTLCSHNEIRYRCPFCKDTITISRIEKLLYTDGDEER